MKLALEATVSAAALAATLVLTGPAQAAKSGAKSTGAEVVAIVGPRCSTAPAPPRAWPMW